MNGKKILLCIPTLNAADELARLLGSIELKDIDVLIIDDIMSSGATIDCAIHLLKGEYINIAQIDVLTLFSSLD